jgi:hypothetical protein
MKNLSVSGESRQEIIARWRFFHPDNKINAVGQGNNGKSTILAKRLNKSLVHSLSVKKQKTQINNK